MCIRRANRSEAHLDRPPSAPVSNEIRVAPRRGTNARQRPSGAGRSSSTRHAILPTHQPCSRTVSSNSAALLAPLFFLATALTRGGR